MVEVFEFFGPSRAAALVALALACSLTLLVTVSFALRPVAHLIWRYRILQELLSRGISAEEIEKVLGVEDAKPPLAAPGKQPFDAFNVVIPGLCVFGFALALVIGVLWAAATGRIIHESELTKAKKPPPLEEVTAPADALPEQPQSDSIDLGEVTLVDLFSDPQHFATHRVRVSGQFEARTDDAFNIRDRFGNSLWIHISELPVHRKRRVFSEIVLSRLPVEVVGVARQDSIVGMIVEASSVAFLADDAPYVGMVSVAEMLNHPRMYVGKNVWVRSQLEKTYSDRIIVSQGGLEFEVRTTELDPELRERLRSEPWHSRKTVVATGLVVEDFNQRKFRIVARDVTIL